MTSRQASDETSLGDRLHPSNAADLPEWLAAGLNRLIAGDPEAMHALAPEVESVPQARHFATTTLCDWGLPGLSDDVALVVSELVTNALRHSLPPHPAAASGPIRLHMAGLPPYVLCGVRDAGDDPPRRRGADFIAETGRGLQIVEFCSERWGWTPVPGGGKLVWALVPGA